MLLPNKPTQVDSSVATSANATALPSRVINSKAISADKAISILETHASSYPTNSDVKRALVLAIDTLRTKNNTPQLVPSVNLDLRRLVSEQTDRVIQKISGVVGMKFHPYQYDASDKLISAHQLLLAKFTRRIEKSLAASAVKSITAPLPNSAANLYAMVFALARTRCQIALSKKPAEAQLATPVGQQATLLERRNAQREPKKSLEHARLMLPVQ
ncbi:hypothetical protein K3495_g5799 [Podosphaera aphanis]|nr:hypothetical protein K3495_g5799 [Podosphaera aphanis]